MAILIIDGDVDIILMDVTLPDPSVEVAQHVAIENLKNVPVIMVTGNAEANQIEKALDEANFGSITCSADKVELIARVQSALKLRKEIENGKAREKQLVDLNARLLKLSSVDGLTGITNRRYFDEVLKREWRRAKRDYQSIAIGLFDMDFFKNYNDTYGHLSGDDCLRKVAATISHTLKRPGDLVARYGGEEFVVILPTTNRSGALQVGEVIRAAIESLQIEHSSSPVKNFLTVSGGIAACIPGQFTDITSPDQLVAFADRALYQAKNAGRNIVLYEDHVN